MSILTVKTWAQLLFKKKKTFFTELKKKKEKIGVIP